MPGQLELGKGKDLDGSNAMGPCLVTADEIDSYRLTMVACVNGEEWGRGGSSEMPGRSRTASPMWGTAKLRTGHARQRLRSWQMRFLKSGAAGLGSWPTIEAGFLEREMCPAHARHKLTGLSRDDAMRTRDRGRASSPKRSFHDQVCRRRTKYGLLYYVTDPSRTWKTYSAPNYFLFSGINRLRKVGVDVRFHFGIAELKLGLNQYRPVIVEMRAIVRRCFRRVDLPIKLGTC